MSTDKGRAVPFARKDRDYAAPTRPPVVRAKPAVSEAWKAEKAKIDAARAMLDGAGILTIPEDLQPAVAFSGTVVSAAASPVAPKSSIMVHVRRCLNVQCRIQTYSAASLHLSLSSCPICMGPGTITSDTLV